VHDALEKTINNNSQQLNLFLIIPILLRMKCSINHSLYAGLIEAPGGQSLLSGTLQYQRQQSQREQRQKHN
jgi:hypothetical protein